MADSQAWNHVPSGRPPVQENLGGPDPTSNGEDSTRRQSRRLFPPVYDVGKGPYFRAFNSAAITQLWPNTFALPSKRRGLIGPGDQAIASSLKVFKTGEHASSDPVQDPWALELSDPSDMTIYVEDLSPRMIEAIGSAFQIFPTVFEDHLRGSAYTGTRVRSEQLSLLDTAAQATGDYITLRWFSAGSLQSLLLQSPASEPPAKVWQDYLAPSGGFSRVWQELLERKLSAPVEIPPWSQWARKLIRDSAACVRICDNIYRQQKRLTAGPNDIFACEEKATIITKTAGASQKLILLLDPNPTFAVLDLNEEHVLEHVTNPANRFRVLESRQSLRAPLLRVDFSDWEALPQSIAAALPKGPLSTYQDIQRWLIHWGDQSRSALPLDALFEVIRIDTLGMIGILDAISRDVHETLSSEHLDWRHFNYQLSKSALLWGVSELPMVCQSLRSLAQFATKAPGDPAFPNDDVAREEKTGLLIDQIGDASIRIRGTLETIDSALALRDSEKGIAESENVIRLTELAFVFIPLTFAAAIFSIQIEEFQKRPPRAWTFVVTAISLVSFVYSIRITRYYASKHGWDRRGTWLYVVPVALCAISMPI